MFHQFLQDFQVETFFFCSKGTKLDQTNSNQQPQKINKHYIVPRLSLEISNFKLLNEIFMELSVSCLKVLTRKLQV